MQKIFWSHKLTQKIYGIYVSAILSARVSLQSVRKSKKKFLVIVNIEINSMVASQIQPTALSRSSFKKNQSFNKHHSRNGCDLFDYVGAGYNCYYCNYKMLSFERTKIVITAFNTAYYILIFSLFASIGAPFLINLKYNKMFRDEFFELLNDVRKIFPKKELWILKKKF